LSANFKGAKLSELSGQLFLGIGIPIKSNHLEIFINGFVFVAAALRFDVGLILGALLAGATDGK